MLIQVYDALFEGNPSSYLLFLALLPTTVSLLLMLFVRIYKTNSVDEKKHLDRLSVVALVLVAYLMVLIILNNVFNLASWARMVTFMILLILLASPLGIAIRAEKEEKKRLVLLLRSAGDNPEIIASPGITEIVSDPIDYQELPGDTCQLLKAASDVQNEDMNLQQAICSVNFWLLFVAMVCGMGSGISTINNISQVGESLGYSTIEINSLVSLISIWNFLGRFTVGYVSDLFLHKKGCPRTLFIAITQAALSVGHIVIALGFPESLYLGSIIVGVCYGSQVPLLHTVTSELFGVGHMATIANTIGIASPVGSYIFSVRIIGYIYDKAASGEGNSCYGTHCFMLSFLIMAFFAVLGCFVALLLFFRTRRFYDQVILRRLRHSCKT